MQLILNLIWTLLFWYFLYILLRQFHPHKKNNAKITRNSISAVHSIGSIFLCLYGFYIDHRFIDFLYYYSTSYFVWDSIYIVVNKKRSEVLYLFHHGVAIYMLGTIYITIHANLLTFFFLLGELSNIPYYIVYRKLKLLECNNNNINSQQLSIQNIKYWQIGQILWFVCLRVVLGGYIGFFTSIYLKLPGVLVILLYCIYFLGIYWGFMQIKNIYRNYY